MSNKNHDIGYFVNIAKGKLTYDVEYGPQVLDILEEHKALSSEIKLEPSKLEIYTDRLSFLENQIVIYCKRGFY